MQTEYLKTLLALRFEKLRETEEQAAWDYQEILDRFLKEADKEEEIIELLSQLVREERMHEKMAADLIKTVHKNHPEHGTLFP